jgi:hypothetical protein
MFNLIRKFLTFLGSKNGRSDIPSGIAYDVIFDEGSRDYIMGYDNNPYSASYEIVEYEAWKNGWEFAKEQ